MWNRIKHWFGVNGDSDASHNGSGEYDFKWYEAGNDNPFPIRILDVRSLTWNIIATTSDINIAKSFNAQRQSDGREFIGAESKMQRPLNAIWSFRTTAPNSKASFTSPIRWKSNGIFISTTLRSYSSAVGPVNCSIGRSPKSLTPKSVFTKSRLHRITFKRPRRPSIS